MCGSRVDFPTTIPRLSLHHAGFADTTVNILNRWFTQHFPMAHTIGENLTAMGNPNGAALRFMAQSWIVSLYLDCPPNAGLACPTPAELATFTDSINKGYITWHAWPHNGEFELADRHMIEYGLSLSHEIDDQFGLPRKATVSQRDVPGTTRASIPILQQLGVQAISVVCSHGRCGTVMCIAWPRQIGRVRVPALLHLLVHLIIARHGRCRVSTGPPSRPRYLVLSSGVMRRATRAFPRCGTHTATEVGATKLAFGATCVSSPVAPRQQTIVCLNRQSATAVPAGITFEDAVVIPGLEHAFIPDWRGDNAGQYWHTHGPPMDVTVALHPDGPSLTLLQVANLDPSPLQARPNQQRRWSPTGRRSGRSSLGLPSLRPPWITSRSS